MTRKTRTTTIVCIRKPDQSADEQVQPTPPSSRPILSLPSSTEHRVLQFDLGCLELPTAVLLNQAFSRSEAFEHPHAAGSALCLCIDDLYYPAQPPRLALASLHHMSSKPQLRQVFFTESSKNISTSGLRFLCPPQLEVKLAGVAWRTSVLERGGQRPRVEHTARCSLRYVLTL